MAVSSSHIELFTLSCRKTNPTTFQEALHDSVSQTASQVPSAHTMAFTMMVRAHFRTTQRLQVKQPNEYELTIVPSDPSSAPSSFPAAHPSRAPSKTSLTSSSTALIASTNTTSTQTAVSKPILKVKNMDMEWKGIDLTVCNIILPRTPVLRPLVFPIFGLTTTIPELWLDLTAPTPMSLPETPVLRLVSDENALKEIPELDLAM